MRAVPSLLRRARAALSAGGPGVHAGPAGHGVFLRTAAFHPGPLVLGGALAGALALSGCGGPVGMIRLEAPEGYAISFPAGTETAAGQDGPVTFRIDAMRTLDEARFEAAWFGFHQPLDAPERLQLLTRVERGIAGDGAKVTHRTETPPGTSDRVDLVVEHPDGRRGFHRILYPTRRSMLQVSAVGPRGGDWEKLVPRFFDSLEVRKREPLDEAPVSASLPPARQPAGRL